MERGYDPVFLSLFRPNKNSFTRAYNLSKLYYIFTKAKDCSNIVKTDNE